MKKPAKKTAKPVTRKAMKKTVEKTVEKTTVKTATKTGRTAKKPKENPYHHGGASEDLFGGPSRKLPKKESEVHRPRVRIKGGTAVLGDSSPWKGRLHKVNPSRSRSLPVPLVKPLTIILSKTEAALVDKATGKPASKLVSEALKAAKSHKGAKWDHIEVKFPNGAHAFDLVP